MKKYKLIKKYPGSPKLGAIVQQPRDEDIFYFDSDDFRYKKDEIENYPDHWEEIRERDFIVMDFDEIGFHHFEGIRIRTVKRFSDKKIFSLGDKTNCGVISEFVNLDNMMRVYFEDKGRYHVNLNVLKYVAALLFTTEDGVDIYEGDSYYFVDKQFRLFAIDKAKNASGKNDYKYFSTEDKAASYISMNKPVFSREQLCNVLGKKDFIDTEYLVNELERTLSWKNY